MKLPKFMSKVSKRSYAVATMAITAVVVPAALFAWGPSSRVTFTLAQPAQYVTFNSITDNKQYGDERNFVQVRSVTDNTQFGENTTLTPGKEYEVFAYFHNNASTDLNDAAHNYAGIATGAFMRTQMPATVAANGEARITSFVGATNAKHLDAAGNNLGNQVWDDAFGKNSTASEIALNYVAGSAKITSKGAVNGQTISDSLFTTGAPLGYDALNGKLPGCLQYSGYVTYRFKVNQPNFTVAKTVSLSAANNYVESVNAMPGSIVDFKIKYQNTGTTTQHATIRDMLPAGLEYVQGSTYYSSSATGNQWKAAGYDTVTQQGLGLGAFLPGGAGFVKFSAKVVTADKLACGVNTLTNTAAADTENGSKSDTASVTVTKDCVPPTPVYRCDSLTVDKISQTEFKFTVAKTVENATYVKTVFVIKNAAGTTVATLDDADGVYNYTQTNPGTYTVAATVVVTVNGAEKTATSAACAKTFTVEATPTHPAVEITKTVNGKKTAEVKVNEQFEYELVVKNTGNVALVNAKVTDAAPAGITFLSADTGTITNNAWSATVSLKVGESKTFKIIAVAKAYIAGVTTNKACVDAAEVTGNPDDCDTATTTMPVPVTACNLDTKKIEYDVEKSKIDNVHYTLDLSKCKETPPTEKIQVCRLDDKHVVIIDKTEYNANKDKYSTNLNDCATAPETCTVPGKETMPKDSPDCKETPVTPTELPHTGIAEGLMSVLGAGSMVGVAAAYVASRKQN